MCSSDLGLGTGSTARHFVELLKSGANPLAKEFDKVPGGRPGAEAELHADAYMLKRARCRLSLQFVHGHARRCSQTVAGHPERRVRRAAYLTSFQEKEQAYTAVFSGNAGITAIGIPHLRDRPGAASDPP